MFIDYFLGTATQHAGAPVVAKSAPRGQYSAFGRCGQRPNIWEALEKQPVMFEDGRDASLLQHDLGEPDVVRISGSSPWQVATIVIVPAQQSSPECGPRRIVEK